MKAKHLVMPTNQNGLGWWAAIHHKKAVNTALNLTVPRPNIASDIKAYQQTYDDCLSM